MHQESLKALLLLLFVVFAIGAIGGDLCLARLTRREYLVAREDWTRDGGPTWWPWQPSELRPWRYPKGWPINNAPRMRWLLSTPAWVKRDRTAHTLHMAHRVLMAIALGSWIVAVWLLMGTS